MRGTSVFTGCMIDTDKRWKLRKGKFVKKPMDRKLKMVTCFQCITEED